MSNKKDLQPIGGTAIYPLGVYSTKVKDIKDLEAGRHRHHFRTTKPTGPRYRRAQGRRSRDAQGRLDRLLTPADIDEAKSKVKVTPAQGRTVATTLKDPTIAAGVINNDYVADAGLDQKDAIYPG